MAIKGLEFAASTVGSPFPSCQIESDIDILRPEKKQRDGICKCRRMKEGSAQQQCNKMYFKGKMSARAKNASTLGARFSSNLI